MSWFSHLIHKFEHVLRHIGAIAADVAAMSFGFPPGAGFAATELLMRAHAGDHHARVKVARLSQNPKMRAFLSQVATHLRAHPHFHAIRAHAEQARMHGGHPDHGPAAALHGPPAPPSHGVPTTPLPPSAYGQLASHPQAAGLTTHSTWDVGAVEETGRAQIVGEEVAGASRPFTGHAPHPGAHHHGHHAHGESPDAHGIDWLLGEQDVLDRIVSPDNGEPEEWRTPHAPRGTPGI
jgi:hypothetical protein